MAVALPVGVLDTLLSATFTLEYSLRLRRIVGAGAATIDNFSQADASLYVDASSGATDLVCTGLGPGVTSYSSVDLILDISGAKTILASGAGACVSPGWLGPVTVRKTLGPLRLGARYTVNTLVWEWYADELTTAAYEVVSGSTYPVATLSFPATPATVGNFQLHAFGFNPFGSASIDAAEFSLFTFNAGILSHATVLTSALIRKFFGPTWAWTIDLAAVGPDGLAVTGPVSGDATYNGNRTFPSSFTRSFEWFVEDGASLGTDDSLLSAGRATLTSQWANAQILAPASSEWLFVDEGQTVLNPAAGAVAAYNVGTVNVADPHPSGSTILLSTNAFAGAGAVAVSGPTNTPTFTTSATGASVSKTLREHWRNWNDPFDALYQPTDGYTATKRAAYGTGANTPDVWGWGLYANLEIVWTAAVAATLVYTVTWATIDENGAVVTFTRDYTKAVTGAGTYTIDLLFPDAGDTPFYGERVDTIAISGFAVGVYTLGTVRLRATEDGYLKYGSRTLGDTGGVTIAQDGQFVHSQWNGDGVIGVGDLDLDGEPDRNKDHQNGIFAYAPSEGDIVATASYGGAFGTTAMLIADVFAELNRMEGMTATYSDAALLAALTDTFSRTIAARPAAWLQPNLPHTRIAKNTNVNLSARIVASDIFLPAGIPGGAGNLRVFQRQRIGMVLEAQTKTAAGGRGGSGQTVTARYHLGGGPSGGDPSLGMTSTDASGFATVPVRNGTSGSNEITVYLEGS